MLRAIAKGAFVLSPEWVHTSLAAGAWLPEDQFESTHFRGCRRSRLAHQEPSHKARAERRGSRDLPRDGSALGGVAVGRRAGASPSVSPAAPYLTARVR